MLMLLATNQCLESYNRDVRTEEDGASSYSKLVVGVDGKKKRHSFSSYRGGSWLRPYSWTPEIAKNSCRANAPLL